MPAPIYRLKPAPHPHENVRHPHKGEVVDITGQWGLFSELE